MKKFSQNVSKSLQHYIYAIYDPYDLTSLPFYIGQGVGNRVFSHLKESHNDSVRAKIDEIRSKGRKPNIKILLHGLNARQANAAESAAIALLGKDILSNKVFGAGSKLINLSTDEIIQHYEAKDVLLKHKIMLIVRNPFDPNRSEQEIYDQTRSAWRVGPKKDFAEYACAVNGGVIKRIYKIAAWVQADSTFHVRNDEQSEYFVPDYQNRPERSEFVGRLLDDEHEISKKYIGKSVKKYLRGSGSSIHYSYNSDGEIYKFNKDGKITNL